MFNAFIPSAGLGTRLYPLTKNTPKALVEIGGKPLLEHQLLKLKRAGVREVVVNVHHFAEQIIDFIAEHQNFGLDIRISDEREQLLNTGGGLKQALQFFQQDLPILVHNVDIFSDLKLGSLLKYHQEKKALATLVLRERSSSRYLQFNEELQLCGWENVKTAEQKIARKTEFAKNYAFSGIQVVAPEIFNKITEQGAFSVIDLYLRLAKIEKIVGFVDRQSRWADVGKYEELQEVEGLFL
ncbi:MAG: nucleotidyltransferase family protein [Flavobacteriaceae bacterium]|nr:nucleotidyltransferase family protein [Flavobacteriaceae bacterium]